ncbi:oligosaccharyl transferase STT3 subunit [archaeon BMS3Abin16]|nr:oligosaccharyl transferase STT3 subunit [archaeon BMS3Abin16]
MIGEYVSSLDKIKGKRLYILLGLIVTLGFIIRYNPFLHRLTLSDTYYQFSIVKSILLNGRAPASLTLADYPGGKNLLNDPLLLPYFIAYTYKFLQPLGVSLTSYMVAFPAFFGALAAVPLYFLAREFFDTKTAVLTSLVYVVLPASIDRTFAGLVEKESLAAITVLIWLYLFIRSAREFDLSSRKTLALPVLSGIFMGLSFLTWRGVAYFSLLIALTILIQLVRGVDKKQAYSLAIMVFSGYLLLIIIQPAEFTFQKFFLYYRFAPLTYLSLFAVASTLSIDVNRYSKKKVESRYVVGLFLCLFILSIFLFNLQSEISEILKSLVNLLRGDKVVATEIQRAASAGYTISKNPFSFLILFIPLGLYYYIAESKRDFRFNNLFVLVWFITAGYASILKIRLFFILAPVAAMMIAYGFFKVLDEAGKRTTLEGEEKSGSMAAILVVILILSIYGTISSEVGFARGLKEYQSERVGHWENALTILKEISPENALVVAWWDYGYVIQGVGERATIADPGGGETRWKDVARILTSNEDDALEIIKKYNEENVPVYVIVSFEEFTLANTINFRADDSMYFYEHTIEKSGSRDVDEQAIDEFLAANNIESYAIENIGKYWRIWFTGFVPSGNEEYTPDPDMKDKLLPKMLPFNTGAGAGLKHFKLVYNDDSNYIFIYQMV